MRYCKRTFFNKLIQPNRIGKHIFRHTKRSWDVYFRKNRAHYALPTLVKFKPKKKMLEHRRGKTPKNAILARHSVVRHFKVYQNTRLRKAQSIFVRRAKLYATT